MNEVKSEILKNSGLNEEVLEEGIVFFKNSKKIQRLSNALTKKADKLSAKGNIEAAKELFRFSREANKIANKFKQLEDEFSIFGSKTEKERIKADYEKVTNEFSSLIQIAKDERFKKTVATAKGLAIVAAILFAGGTLLAGMESSMGTLTKAGENLGARASNLVTTSSSTDTITDIAGRRAERMAKGIYIKQTNDALMKTALASGATVGTVVGSGVLNKLKKSGIKNKAISDTVRAIEELKSVEDQRYN